MLSSKKELSTWEKCLQVNLGRRLVQVQRQLVRLKYAPSSSASTDISGESDDWEDYLQRAESKKNSMIMQDAEIDVLVAAEQEMDDHIIAGHRDDIDSDELSL